MCWADRATLILAFLWGGFLFLLLGPQNPYAFSGLWWEGMAFLFGVPVAAVWIVLRLALGGKGATYYAKPKKPGYLKDRDGNVVHPLRPDTADPSVIDH